MNNVLARHCGGARYVVKIDDDVLVDLPSLRDTLTRKHPGASMPDTIQVIQPLRSDCESVKVKALS